MAELFITEESRAQHRSSSLSYQFSVETKGNGGEKTEDVPHEDEVVAAGVGVHDDPPVVELVVYKDEDDGEDDADNADGEHRDVESHGHRPDFRSDDGPVLGRVAFPPPDNFLPCRGGGSIINKGEELRSTSWSHLTSFC